VGAEVVRNARCDRCRVGGPGESGVGVNLWLLGQARGHVRGDQHRRHAGTGGVVRSDRGDRGAALRVAIGQYLGFGAILVISVLGTLGAGLLPESAIPYLGLLPLLLGLRAAWKVWREHRAGNAPDEDSKGTPGVGMLEVATVTFANGGDNIGVYVPVFAVVGVGGMVGYLVVFLVGLALWCAIGRFLAGRPVIAKVLSRWRLWVPEARPIYATCVYSWITPPSRSRLMILMSVVSGWGSARSGAAWPSVRCGRWVLKWVSYSASTRIRCRALTMSIRSRTSRRRLPIQRSMIAFARGTWIGVLMI
jgi:cadmium resistance protein CadD (predicted permease)